MPAPDAKNGLNSSLRGKILFVAPSAYPLGGLATWLDYLIPGLEKKGWKIVLGLTAGRFHDIAAYQKAHPPGKIVEIAARTGTREGRIRSLCKAIFGAQPDLVVGVNIPDAYAAVERLRAKIGICPRVVMTLHGIQPDLYEDIREFRDTLDGVISTNRLACRLVREDAGLERDRVYYAPYGVEVPSESRKLSSSDCFLRIAYSGRLDQFQKRVNDIPKILEALDRKGISYELAVAGSGPTERDLKESLSSKENLGNIKFFGVLSYNDLVERVYKQNDILLVTSSWETGPIVIWEAMAHGMAVVTSNYVGSGLEGNLRHEENCLMFPVGDFERAAECLASLTDLSVRKKMAKGGYETVTEHYTRNRSVEYWYRCFKAICSSPSRVSFAINNRLPPAGRLDRLFGVRLAETLRQLVGKQFVHKEPGGEWPHSYGKRKLDDEGFWKMAKALDRHTE